MRFTIPQFIEREPKIVGPLTLRQFTYIGIPGGICFILYFIATPFIFYTACLFLGPIGLAFAFLKIDNIPFPTLIVNFFKYSLSPKMYLWRRKGVKEEVFEEQVTIKKEKIPEDELPLKINKDSRLKNIKTKLETK